MSGILHRFFAADHDRLDVLLRRAIADPERVDLAPFGHFRAGILRHIGMEERHLFVVAKAAGGQRVVELAARLRVDHGAIAALLVPTPTPDVVADLLSVLDSHNRREEEPGGIYELADVALAPAGAERLVTELERFPEPPLKPYNDAPAVAKHIAETLALSRRQWEEGR
jgi:hypothetical protein